jgi:putative ABC transport system ATP-binding protein
VNAPVIALRGVRKVYGAGETAVEALRPTDLDFAAGGFHAIMGPSGSGKSTLLNLLGLLDRPTDGRYLLAGEDVADLDDDARSAVRCRRIGFIFQSFNLLHHLSILDNVRVPMQYAGVPPAGQIERARRLLDELGLGDRTHHRPAELSGGQCQRAAIARALANDPPILLADEPTGNLDEKTGDEVLAVFDRLCAAGRTVILVTHNPAYRDRVARTVELHDGRVTAA